jgi:hypothetical protein
LPNIARSLDGRSQWKGNIGERCVGTDLSSRNVRVEQRTDCQRERLRHESEEKNAPASARVLFVGIGNQRPGAVQTNASPRRSRRPSSLIPHYPPFIASYAPLPVAHPPERRPFTSVSFVVLSIPVFESGLLAKHTPNSTRCTSRLCTHTSHDNPVSGIWRISTTWPRPPLRSAPERRCRPWHQPHTQPNA